MKDKIGFYTLKKIKSMDNYNKWIFDKIKYFIGDSIFEIGSGIGNITDFIKKKERIMAIDIDDNQIDLFRKTFGKQDNIKIFKEDITKIDLKKYNKNNFDTAICLNVLEHVKYDDLALKNIYGMLQKNANLILLVPANKFLYCGMDKNLSHYRRYSKKELVDKVKKAGFKMEKAEYMNFIGIFGWFVNGKLLRRKVLPSNQLNFLNLILPIFIYLEKILPPFTGLSLLIVAKK